MIESPDLESRANASDHLSLRLWLRLISLTNLIEKYSGSRMRAEFGTTLARFDLLAQLERRADGLKMSDLSEQLMVTGGNVTRLVAQLESEKLVVREVSDTDRRVVSVRLTAAGRRTFLTIAKRHEVWIRTVLAGVSRKDQQLAHSLLGKLKTSVIEEVR